MKKETARFTLSCLVVVLLASGAVAGEPAGIDASLSPPGPELVGVWRLVESSAPDAKDDGWAEVTPTHWVVAAEGQLQYRSPLLGVAGPEVMISLFGSRQRRLVEIEGDVMVVRYDETRNRFRPEPRSVVERYRRSSQRPEALSLATVALGDAARPVGEERLAAIRAELAERGERDQEVRKIFSTPGAQPSREDQDRMMETDRENTSYLLSLIAEVGWIDPERFGEETAESAWLIVQHSQDLSLRWTVLRELERRLEETGSGDGRFALLWDRTQIWLGRKQRFGSQIFYGPEGMFVPPLEDPELVDELRASVGLGPLEEYLERFRERNDGKPVPVREHD